MVRTDLYHQKINDLKEVLKEAGYSLDIDTAKSEIENLEKELEKEEVYTTFLSMPTIQERLKH